LDLTLSAVELWGQQNGLIDKETDPAGEFVKRHGKISSLLEQIPKMGIEELGNRFAEILGALENQEGERVEEMECVFHWLDCLYQDFRNRRTAGEQFPCNTCKKVGTCDNCPPVMFNLAGEKFGLKVNYTTPKSK